METKISPFTRTPGIAGNALIKTHYSDEIIQNFESSESFQYVYKIVGLRGSGKSVEYSIVMNHFRSQKNWLVYALSAGGDPIQALISALSKEAFVDDKTRSQSYSEHYYSTESELRDMLKRASQKGYSVLIGIDDIAKTNEMSEFLSILGMIIMEEEYNVRFICTGLSKNIEDFLNVPHLSFFVRNETITMKPLDLHAVAAKYRTLLSASPTEAATLAKFTQGYAYGYQVLGDICFRQNKTQIDSDIENSFDEIIGNQYDLLWDTLTSAEQELVRIILNTESGQVSEIKEKMAKSSGFTSLRDRLIKKHILISENRGTLTIPLPRFKEYVETWH